MAAGYKINPARRRVAGDREKYAAGLAVAPYPMRVRRAE